MMAAVVCARLALARGYSEQARARLISAALTHDFLESSNCSDRSVTTAD